MLLAAIPTPVLAEAVALSPVNVHGDDSEYAKLVAKFKIMHD